MNNVCPKCAMNIAGEWQFCPQCGLAKAQSQPKPSTVGSRLSRLKKAGLVIGGVLAISVVFKESPEDRVRAEQMNAEQAQYEAANPPAAQSASLLSSSAGVTKSEYDLLETGMTYEQAREIIGEPGEELSRSDLAGYVTVMYAWKNANGSNMNAMFQNGRMVTKAQFGLRP